MTDLSNSLNWQHSWVVANWKMNPNSQAATADLLSNLAQKLNTTDYTEHCNVVVAPTFIHLSQVASYISQHNLPVNLAAQNLCAQSADKGAFTGEVSAAQLKNLGVEFVIIGHSERRQYFKEDNQCLTEKIKCAFLQGLAVILCVGETESQYEQQQTQSVIKEQLSLLSNLKAEFDTNQSQLIIAYEPVWAIGTGKIPTIAEVEAVHHFINNQLTQIHSNLATTPILYGGSVKAENAVEIANCPHVSGVLVGGASLDATSFCQIIEAFTSK